MEVDPLLDLVWKLGKKKKFTVFRTRSRVSIYDIRRFLEENRSGREKLDV